jgi:hypothetical protein
MKASKLKVGMMIRLGNKDLIVTSVIEHQYLAFIYMLETLDGKTKYEYIPTRGIYIIK